MRFSVVSIVWNEEERLERCLSQFKDYSEDIVVFDTESTDRTNEIAKAFTNKVWLVPFVGYSSAYDCQAWLKAKYDWCLCVCPDEDYGDDMLDWIKSLDANIPESVVAFKRTEVIDGVVNINPSGYHVRLINRCTVWNYELLDPPFHLGNSILYSDKYFLHIKSRKEMEIDYKNRLIAGKLLAEKYKYTNLYPWSEAVKSYNTY